MYVARRGQKEKEGRGGRGYILVIWGEPVREWKRHPLYFIRVFSVT